MSLVLNIVLIVGLVLAGPFALAVTVGKAIKRHQADTDQFRRNLRDPNRDNDRDGLGGHR